MERFVTFSIGDECPFMGVGVPAHWPVTTQCMHRWGLSGRELLVGWIHRRDQIGFPPAHVSTELLRGGVINLVNEIMIDHIAKSTSKRLNLTCGVGGGRRVVANVT